MSAYTMPGAIFPPISGISFGCISEKSKTKNDSCNAEKVEKKESKTLLDIFDILENKKVNNSNKFDSILDPPTIEKENNNQDLVTFQNEVGISVKEAKINPIRLVQSLTSPKKGKKVQRTTLTSESKQDMNNEENCEIDDDPHGEAIEFELSISFNGRTYIAKRSLPSIIKLRDDLILEMKNRSKKLNIHSIMRNRKRESNNYQRESPEECDDFDKYKLQQEKRNYTEDELNMTIPEVPKYYPEEKCPGGQFALSGFTMLQALLHQYCPIIEGWLRKVTDVVSPFDSPSFSNFLWEPLFNETSSTSETTILSRRSSETKLSRKSSLQSITEDEPEDEDF